MLVQIIIVSVVSLWALVGNFHAEAAYYSHEHSANMENHLPSVSRPSNHSYTFYGIMFDAGSTGTRIHVYTFIQKDPAELPVLDNEMYHAVKPGLSAYADKPEVGGDTIRQLLKLAKKTVPRSEWKKTPVVLKATAGLRLLPEEKARALLEEKQLFWGSLGISLINIIGFYHNAGSSWFQTPTITDNCTEMASVRIPSQERQAGSYKVKEVFAESPFFIPNTSVSIMNGKNEGVLAWVTVNFLTGHLYSNTKRTVGILDLGGGSTQITFLPKSKKTVTSAPPAYIARFNLYNGTYELYTHSYLGNGLIAARLATLGALGADGLDWRIFKSSCLPKKFREDWTFGGLTYRVSGIPDGYAGYKLCYYEVMKVIKGVVHQPFEVKGSSIFYAFSYYFDRAVESGLIDGSRGGIVEVRDFKKRAKEVCNKMTKYRPISPFLCMDMTYITCLLKEGFGFKDSTVLQLAKKVNNVETSWALGATFDYFRNLNIH